ncbi:hypothetical protein EGR_05131 [Echinococcus granulosus]|uniref:Uncharacterized protein n=1 Tax=Echinococcus granulosus TaxID=6210 RepID=W6UF02_ECHGR|nr:hypothetical protein EGR_05131 [Echinococcus granulosus]EUB59970.1 hypothetical protein EGR_05131 [Echinococcus granulosus]
MLATMKIAGQLLFSSPLAPPQPQFSSSLPSTPSSRVHHHMSSLAGRPLSLFLSVVFVARLCQLYVASALPALLLARFLTDLSHKHRETGRQETTPDEERKGSINKATTSIKCASINNSSPAQLRQSN